MTVGYRYIYPEKPQFIVQTGVARSYHILSTLGGELDYPMLGATLQKTLEGHRCIFERGVQVSE